MPVMKKGVVENGDEEDIVDYIDKDEEDVVEDSDEYVDGENNTASNPPAHGDHLSLSIYDKIPSNT